MAWGSVSGASTVGSLEGRTDGSSPPTTVRQKAVHDTDTVALPHTINITFPVKRGDNWKVVTSNTSAEVVMVLPIGV